MIKMLDWLLQLLRFTSMKELYQKDLPFQDLVFISNQQQIHLSNTLNTSKNYLWILHHRLLDYMITLKLQTHKTKHMKCFRPFFQFNQKLELDQENQEKKWFHRLPHLSNQRHLKSSHFMKFRKNIQPVTKSQWIQYWCKKYSDTINFCK